MYNHILLAADLTEHGQIAAQKAQELASRIDAKLSIIHIVEPIPAYGYPGLTDIESPRIDEAKKALSELSQTLNVPPENQHTKVGPTKIEILEMAESLSVDLIVVGTHGRHGLSLLLGSTANAILHGAKCDVLAVRVQD